jgi:ribosomal protein L12E/L44/L45/RPP1/RPP2
MMHDDIEKIARLESARKSIHDKKVKVVIEATDRVVRTMAKKFIQYLGEKEMEEVISAAHAIVSHVATNYDSDFPLSIAAVAFHEASVARYCTANHWKLKKGKRPSLDAIQDYLTGTCGDSCYREIKACLDWLWKHPVPASETIYF